MSRLEKIFILLETGSNPQTRKLAAAQIGEVVKSNPLDMFLVLEKLYAYLSNANWPTRIAAVQAVENILKNVPRWEPIHVKEELIDSEWKVDEQIKEEIDEPRLFDSGNLTLEKFDLSEVMKSGDHLLSRHTQEYEVDEDSKPGNQRQQLNEKLGLDAMSSMGMDTSNIISNEDLLESQRTQDQIDRQNGSKKGGDTSAVLSAREINRLKRKSRLEGKPKDEPEDAGDTKRLKTEPETKIKLFHGERWLESPSWPYQLLLDHLLTDVFASKWEKRHGAATALRELLKFNGFSGGKVGGLSAEENLKNHQSWLVNIALRLVSVLALDKFGDFVSDQVVAPVRESSAQALGTVLKLLDSDSVIQLVHILLKLADEKGWECRHGGILGVKYALAVRTDLVDTLLPLVYPTIDKSLNDESDDVVAVSASALLPVVSSLVDKLDSVVPNLSRRLWNSLLDLDDLTTSTHSIMELLADILARPKGLELSLKNSGSQLKDLVPRLFPFLSHSSIQVRKAALETLLVLSSSETGQHWLPQCILDILRHVYQRALLEHNSSCLSVVPRLWNSLCENTPLQPLLMAGCPWFGPWIHLISGPSNQPLDPGALIHPKDGDSVFYLGGREVLPIVDQLEKEKYITRARNMGAQLLGKLATYIILPIPGIEYTEGMETPLQMLLSKVLIPQLGTNSAYQKLSISIIIIQWLEQTELPEHSTTTQLATEILRNLTCNQNYAELVQQKNKLVSDATDFTSTLRHYNLLQETIPSTNLTVNKIEEILANVKCSDNPKIKPKAVETIMDRRSGVMTTLQSYVSTQQELELVTLSMLASSLSCLGPSALPDKLNPVLKPLMESVKRERNAEFQKIAVKGLVRVLESCLSRETSPLDKVIINLCTFACSHPEETPQVDLIQFGDALHPTFGIISHYFRERQAEKALRNKFTSKKQNEVTRSSGVLLQSTVNLNNQDHLSRLDTQCRGAQLAIQELVKHFGADTFNKIRKLEELSFHAVLSNQCEVEDLVNCLKILEIMVPVIPDSLKEKIKSAIPSIMKYIVGPHTAVRYAAASCLTALAKVLRSETMNAVILQLVPQLDSNDLTVRQGVIETLFCLSESLTLDIVPYIVLLVVPVLGRMSDQNQDVRMVATNTFATLIKLMPLEEGVPDPPNMPAELLTKKEEQKYFLAQLMNSKSAEKYELQVKVNADLRSYQVAGVNWLGFLNRYKLHGILCDDMGLGKTLQTICLLANHHHTRAQAGQTDLQSLVVCPATLGGHWLEEISKFASPDDLNPFLYIGSMSVRSALKSQVSKHNVIITSYDIVRNDIEFFASIQWSYLVLDEGHVIKNTKSKTSLAIRKLVSSHRLILSGTPIQNGVTELWALFDFLMPGYLGTENQFNHRYARPILNSRDAKSTVKEQETGVLAMEALHRQTLPFILRRVKEDVLKDLPPKITQDYYCDLSPLQTQLYEDFARTQSQNNEEKEPSLQSSHVFQALQYLKKVCNHPKLVLTPEHPLYETAVTDYLDNSLNNLLDISHSAKLTALKQLLTDLGIVGETGCVVNQHRALVFCQLKTMLDIVENDLLKVHFPNVTYLRLDGSVAPQLRHGIVTRFNNDPSIDLLLLTTSVGGLGLNLTGADTVIFVEHDWNPMKDLQAMDRAHRIGQKRVVNVYRLITRNTLEEKIMSLQKFKIHTARTVITSENSCLQSMGTDQVLDLFSLRQEDSKHQKKDETSMKSILENLPELWDDSQYTEEYDMSAYIANLKS